MHHLRSGLFGCVARGGVPCGDMGQCGQTDERLLRKPDTGRDPFEEMLDWGRCQYISQFKVGGFQFKVGISQFKLGIFQFKVDISHFNSGQFPAQVSS